MPCSGHTSSSIARSPHAVATPCSSKLLFSNIPERPRKLHGTPIGTREQLPASAQTAVPRVAVVRGASAAVSANELAELAEHEARLRLEKRAEELAVFQERITGRLKSHRRQQKQEAFVAALAVETEAIRTAAREGLPLSFNAFPEDLGPSPYAQVFEAAPRPSEKVRERDVRGTQKAYAQESRDAVILAREQAAERERQHREAVMAARAAEAEAAAKAAEAQRRVMEELAAQAAASRTSQPARNPQAEHQRFQQALKASVIDKVHRASEELPSLCLCGSSLERGACAINCPYYGAPNAFLADMSQYLRA
eukprot:tig00001154_g7303.t1